MGFFILGRRIGKQRLSRQAVLSYIIGRTELNGFDNSQVKGRWERRKGFKAWLQRRLGALLNKPELQQSGWVYIETPSKELM